MRSRVFLAVCLQVLSALAAPKLANDPSVNLGNGVFTGKTSGSVQKFLGIPFAQPPYALSFPFLIDRADER